MVVVKRKIGRSYGFVAERSVKDFKAVGWSVGLMD
jgi:hypothetical protein